MRFTWEKHSDVSTDKACSMTGKHAGAHVLIKQVASEDKFTHHAIHHEALAYKKMSQNL